MVLLLSPRGGQITSKGDGLLRSNLPLGDSLLRGAGYFVTVPSLSESKVRLSDTELSGLLLAPLVLAAISACAKGQLCP